MVLPNLLLAGAPKCGTTSVYDWLVAHPDISGGVDKELFYLIDNNDRKYNESRNWYKQGISGYSKLFAMNSKWIVDGTTVTMYQDAALEYVRIEKPKVVFFVREPAMRVYSNFKYFKNNRSMLPQNINFQEYLSMLSSGDVFSGNNQLRDAIEHSHYVKYISDFFEILSPENIKIFVFEDFVKDPLFYMIEICGWLDIDYEYYEDYIFSKQNESVNVKSPKLNLIKERFSSYLGREFKFKWMRDFYRKFNTKPALKYENIEDQDLILELRREFLESNERLNKEFDVDLSAWHL